MATKKSTNTPSENRIPAPKNSDGEIVGLEKDLDIKIQNLSSQLLDLRQQLREVRGETVGTTHITRIRFKLNGKKRGDLSDGA